MLSTRFAHSATEMCVYVYAVNTSLEMEDKNAFSSDPLNSPLSALRLPSLLGLEAYGVGWDPSSVIVPAVSLVRCVLVSAHPHEEAQGLGREEKWVVWGHGF